MASDTDSDEEMRTVGLYPPTLYAAPFPTEYVVIVLHGYCEKNIDMYSWLSPAMIIRDHIRFVFPQAAYRAEKSSSGKQKLETSWFDYTTDHGGKFEDEVDSASLVVAQDRVYRIIDQEVSLGTELKNIGLVGVSQGGCLAVHMGTILKLRFVASLVGHRMKITSGPLLSPWFALNVTNDTCFPLELIKDSLKGAECVEIIENNHELTAGENDGRQFVERIVDDLMPSLTLQEVLLK